MTLQPTIVDEAEGLIRRVADAVTRPHDGECLCCYLARLLDQFPCDGSHRLAVRYRDANAPRATALDQRLSRLGACCCDCEVFLNGYELAVEQRTPPPCGGVRRGSLKPCPNWVRVRRGY